MYAILETGSKQYKVEEGDVLEIERLDETQISEDNTVHFNNVLLLKDKELFIGQPLVENACIQAKVLEEFKGQKVIVFKKESKKQYRRTRGHRQILHRIQIEKIGIGSTPASTEASDKPEPTAKPSPKRNPAKKTAKTDNIESQAQNIEPTQTPGDVPPDMEKEKE